MAGGTTEMRSSSGKTAKGVRIDACDWRATPPRERSYFHCYCLSRYVPCLSQYQQLRYVNPLGIIFNKVRSYRGWAIHARACERLRDNPRRRAFLGAAGDKRARSSSRCSYTAQEFHS